MGRDQAVLSIELKCNERLTLKNRTLRSDHAKPHAHEVLILWAALVASGLLFALWDVSNLDNAVSKIWGTTTGFALKSHPFWGLTAYKLERLMAWACMAALLWMVVKPPAFAPVFQAMPFLRRGLMLAGVIAALLLIQWFKRKSLTSCPWDYQMFGGLAQDISHWRFGVADGGPGRCFPAGHPSAGFAFLSVPAFVLLSSPRPAQWLAFACLSLGGLLGLTQVARGAHFVSHVMWSAWWCGAVACAVVLLCLAWEQRAFQRHL